MWNFTVDRVFIFACWTLSHNNQIALLIIYIFFTVFCWLHCLKWAVDRKTKINKPRKLLWFGEGFVFFWALFVLLIGKYTYLLLFSFTSLHRHLVEHLNAEIVLRTLTDVTVALQWIRSTFLYIRALKNPTHYGLLVVFLICLSYDTMMC